MNNIITPDPTRTDGTAAGGQFSDPVARQQGISASKDRLLEDLRTLVADGEDLLRSTASLSGDKLVTARDKFERHWRNARAKLNDAQSYAREQGGRSVVVADDYVHDNPWTAITVAGGIGFFLGMLVARRR